MIDKLDKALEDLVGMALEEIAEAKAAKNFSKNFAEAVCIVLSMAYGRWENDDDK